MSDVHMLRVQARQRQLEDSKDPVRAFNLIDSTEDDLVQINGYANAIRAICCHEEESPGIVGMIAIADGIEQAIERLMTLRGEAWRSLWAFKHRADPQPLPPKRKPARRATTKRPK